MVALKIDASDECSVGAYWDVELWGNSGSAQDVYHVEEEHINASYTDGQQSQDRTK
jgi:hypothetical protein